jgi:hypothetical protein
MGLFDDERQRTPQVKGHVAEATVTALRDTGITVNDQPRVEVDLLVAPSACGAGDGASYPATVRQFVSRIVLPSLQPGAVVPIRIDPADRNRIVLAP